MAAKGKSDTHKKMKSKKGPNSSQTNTLMITAYLNMI